MFINCVKALLGLGGGGRVEAITSAHAVMPLCGVHYTVCCILFHSIRNNYDGHDVESRVRMPLSTLSIGIVRRADCGMQHAVTGRPWFSSECLGWVCMGIYRRRVGNSGK